MVSAILATLLAAVASSTTAGLERYAATLTPAERAAAVAALDPADLAMAFPPDRPCESPCWKTGLVYQHTASAFDPQAGVKSYALDLYRSAKTPRRDAPVVVLLHGGGFVTGDRGQMRTVAEALARRGFLAASITYRLVPESRNRGAGIASDQDLIPASAEAEADAERALRWIRKHRASLGAAAEQRRYAVGGYSAGGITALRVGLRSTDAATLPALRFKIGAAFAFSGTECGPWLAKYNCAGAYDKHDAPLLLFQGETDTIVRADWARQTCEAAQASGGGCKGYYYPGQDHFWLNGKVFGGAEGLTKQTPAAIPTITKFLRKHLSKD
jgi:acetyl esterase/lipase